MANLITEVTGQSVFGRIGKSFVGMLVGLALLIGSVVLLFWNEGRAVATAKSLREGAATVIDVPSDKVDPANNSKLIHVTGDTAATDPLEDPLFKISESGIRLRRNIQVFEWKEKKESKTHDKVGGGKETTTTYSYEKAWSPELTKSSKFKSPEDHHNPEKLQVSKQEFVAKDATLGQFKLTPKSLAKSLVTKPSRSLTSSFPTFPRRCSRSSRSRATSFIWAMIRPIRRSATRRFLLRSCGPARSASSPPKPSRPSRLTRRKMGAR